MINYTYNKQSLLKDGKPWFPIMGEMHYSRYPKKFWKESLYKMKAGGVEIVSSYIIWIHHEEIEGEYDFSGQRDLRTFVEYCDQCGLKFFIRLGPWVHAEARNGGFPDWILKKDYEVRVNDERYFEEVKKYYQKIYQQVKGLLHKDGGPIIGAQIENEYGHVGGLTGDEGEKHISRLTKIAKDVGFELPLYTATGWGGAITGGLIPVMGGYCEAPWDQSTTELEPSVNYLFTHERNDHGIACDHGHDASITFNPDDFPYLTAELGGGLQVTHHRRPIAESKDIGAMSLAKLGSGVALLGYYMYHGGTNPDGKLTTLQESRATGYPNDLPELSYDFRGAIREFGQMSETLKEIKLLSMFTKDFGSALAQMPAYIPESNPLTAENLKDLRTSIRHDDYSGYVFVNNYQRHYEMARHENVELKAELSDETIGFPPIDIDDGDFFFLPFNIKIGSSVLKSALATPLCKINDTVVFYSDKEPEYNFEGEIPKIITLSRQDALNAWKVRFDKEYIIISSDPVIENGRSYDILSSGDTTFKIHPKPHCGIDGFTLVSEDADFATYKSNISVQKAACSFEKVMGTESHYKLSLSYPENIDDCFISIDYGADSAKAYVNGKAVTDDFYSGERWEIGLKRFDFPTELIIELFPLHEDDKIYLEKWPEMQDGKACEINSVCTHIEQRLNLKF